MGIKKIGFCFYVTKKKRFSSVVYSVATLQNTLHYDSLTSKFPPDPPLSNEYTFPSHLIFHWLRYHSLALSLTFLVLDGFAARCGESQAASSAVA